MNKVFLFCIIAVFCLTTIAFALTDEQRAEQRSMQESAQRAYQASADSYDEAASGWTSAKETSQDVVKGSAMTLIGGATGGTAGAVAGAAAVATDEYYDRAYGKK